MMRFSLVVLALFPALAAAQDSAAATPRSHRIDDVVGIVGSEPILRSEVVAAATRLIAEGVVQAPPDSAGQVALMRQLLDSIVDARVLFMAAEEAEVEVNEDAIAAHVDQEIEQIRARFPGDSVFRRALEQAGYATVEAFRSDRLEQTRMQEKRRLFVQQLRTDGKLPTVGVTEADILELWEEAQPTIGRRLGGYTWRQIVLPVRPKPEAWAAARAKADSLHAQIVRVPEPENQLILFEQLARRESMDGTRELGGDLGFQRRGSLVPEFERWAFQLQVNQISPVFETIFGFHLLRVDRIQSSQVKVRHIVIVPETDSTDIQATIALADSLATALKGGASFDSIASRYHDPAELRGRPTPVPVDSLVDEYANAMRGLGPNEISAPFVYPNPRGEPRVRLVIVTGFEEPRDYTLDDFRARIRDELAHRKALRRLLDQLRKDYYVAVRL